MTDDQFELLITIDAKVTALLLNRDDHETRLRKLERFRGWVAGVGSAITAFFTYVFASSHTPH